MADNQHCAKGEEVILEDSAFILDRMKMAEAELLAQAIHPLLFTSGDLGVSFKDFAKRFVILQDEDFSWYAQQATQVETRIALDPATKTVKDGALFTQESVPPEAVFISLITAEAPRVKEGDLAKITTAEAAIIVLAAHLPPVLQVGSDATVGKGLCATHLLTLTGKG